MMLTKTIIRRMAKAAVFVTANGLLAACSMMEVDRSGCPQGLNIHVVYDYNTQQADMFQDHVGGITVYVFDDQGKLVAEHSASNGDGNEPLKAPDFHFEITGLPVGEYRVLATAMQRNEQEALAAPGAKFRIRHPMVGEEQEQLQVVLDHDAPDAEGLADVPHEGLPLDTLWMSRGDVTVSTEEYNPSFATVSLMRQTKNIHVSLMQTVDTENLRHEDYEVSITADDGRLGYDGSVIPGTLLRYTPYQEWTTTLTDDGQSAAATAQSPQHAASVLDRAAHYEFFTSRLMAASTLPTLLTVKNRRTGEVVFCYDLPRLLANGRSAYELQRWSEQEYLDREYDYNLQIILAGDRWDSVVLSIAALSWSRRIQNVDL